MTSLPPLIIVWYKRDLRVSDHAPLSHAIEHAKQSGAKLIAFYSFEPSVTNAPDFSAFHRQFIEESLRDLAKSLTSIGISLVIRSSEIIECLEEFRSQYRLISLYSHEETGNHITYMRDKEVAKYL